MYYEIVFYLEACESGSMFPNLQASQRVYAMTASNASLSSWAAYCGLEARAEGKLIRSCLGDEFSVSWMEDTDAHDISVETLQEQYETTLTLTTQSPVQKFGDFDFMGDAIGVFEGTLEETSYEEVVDEVTDAGEPNRKRKFRKWGEKMLHKFEKAGEKVKEFIKTEVKPSRKIDSRDVRFTQAFENYLESGTAEDFEILNTELAHRGRVDKFFAAISPGFKMDEAVTVSDWDCYRFLIDSYEQTCEPFSDYSLKYAKVFADVCNQHESRVASVYGLMSQIC